MKVQSWILTAVMLMLTLPAAGQEMEKRLDEKRRAMEQYKRAMELQMKLAKKHATEKQKLHSLYNNFMRREVADLERAKFHTLELTAEREQNAIDFLQEAAPKYLQQVKPLKSENDAMYRERLLDALFSKAKIDEKAGSDKKYRDLLYGIFALERQTEMMLGEYEKTDSPQRAVKRRELRQALEALFDLREKDRARDVEALALKLKALRENLELRKQNKELIVDNRLKQMLGEAGNLEWD